ncbi:hypothetical protein UFOVP682_48 [uncultured Caudovirales phage]|uniref:Uncharacterized protein n=1 Tax=uncultured Caudovirales phage TaxID=2100421 RepID=A0A6J5NFS1_9CAUD|nr:hypothetical protein UFOVP682_48 [uncultured Caudovirales phage]
MNIHPTEEQLNAYLKFAIGLTFCLILILMASLSMYSVVFVTQPMSGMAPADKQFFLLLSDMSKYILGALATLIAVKGKDALPQFIPPNLSKPEPETPRPPPVVTTTTTIVRSEGEAPAATTGFAGKKAPPPAHEPEI